MEVIGLAASLPPLINILSSAAELVQRLPNAYDEVASFKSGITHVATQLQLLAKLPLADLCDGGHLTMDDISQVNDTITQAENSIVRIAGAMTRLTSGHGARFRVKWVFKRGTETKSMLEDLLKTEELLDLTLTMLMCYSAAQGNSVLRHVDREISHITADWDRIRTALGILTPFEPARGNRGNDYATKDSTTPSRTWSKKYSSEETFSGHGMAVQLTARKDDRRARYALSAQLGLPYSFTVVVNILLQTYATSWLTFSILRGSTFSVVNFVPEDCAFMRASGRGDVLTMKDLLDRGCAAANDVTTENMTPMSLAIESGNAEAVDLLIEYGADVDGLFGQLQTSPLAWAIGCRQLNIARLLLSYGASCQHVTSWGWSPVYYLWQETHYLMPSAEEYLILLASRPDFRYSHSGMADIEGFGVIHRASIFGTAEEVSTLVRIGVDPFSTVGPLLWTALHNAVFYDRLDIFEVLLPHFQYIPIDTPDPRGWTLLHISASAGNNEITRRLLQLGAGVDAMSRPSYSHMPEELYGGTWTPADVAKAQSEERWVDFLNLVQEVSGDSALTAAELAAITEDWRDALEVI